MAVIAVYDETNLNITHFNYSANLPDYPMTNKLVNPDLTGFWNSGGGFIIPLRYWKYDGVSGIIEATQDEKDVIDGIGLGDNNYVNVVEYDDDFIDGLFKTIPVTITIPNGSGVNTFTISFDYNISILSVKILPHANVSGDKLSLEIMDSDPEGQIISDASAGSGNVRAQVKVLNRAKTGHLLTISDGTNTENCGYIKNINYDNKRIFFTNNLVNSYLASTPTELFLNTEVFKDLPLIDNYGFDLGTSKIGSSLLKRNKNLEITYDRSSGTGFDYTFLLEVVT